MEKINHSLDVIDIPKLNNINNGQYGGYKRKRKNRVKSKPSKRKQQSKPIKRKQQSKPSKKKQQSKPSKRKQQSKPSKRKQQSNPSKRKQQPKSSKDTKNELILLNNLRKQIIETYNISDVSKKRTNLKKINKEFSKII